MVMHGERGRGGQLCTLLFTIGIALIVTSVVLFISGLCWVMVQMTQT